MKHCLAIASLFASDGVCSPDLSFGLATQRFMLTGTTALVLVGCGSVAPIVALDAETYMAGSHGVLGNGSAAMERSKAVQAAQEFCARKSKRADVVQIESVDPFFAAHLPLM